ncbi:hypothetical protein PR003_g28176 [Phytophthora rubi]|nr:hypothetical protein PR003_g28176 [Phytophthora rubi]
MPITAPHRCRRDLLGSTNASRRGTKGWLRRQRRREKNCSTKGGAVSSALPMPEKQQTREKPLVAEQHGSEESIGIVFAIVDRVVDGSEYRYRVKWRDEPDGHRWQDSWLLGSSLREDGFDDACDAVDAWKLTGAGTFYECRRTTKDLHDKDKTNA